MRKAATGPASLSTPSAIKIAAKGLRPSSRLQPTPDPTPGAGRPLQPLGFSGCTPLAATLVADGAGRHARSGEFICQWSSAVLRRLLGRSPAPPTQLAVLEGYARWAATYEQDMDGHPLALAESGAVQALLPSCEGTVALDAACGTGRYARLLAARGARQVIGIDQSAAMLERARALAVSATSTEILFQQGDLLDLPQVDHSCDLAIVALALSHLETAQLGRAFAEFSRVLKPGGVLLMSEMHPFGALTGGRCRFETTEGGRQRVYHIQTHTHLHEDYLAAARAANLTLESLREPRLTPELFPAFERANMAAFARQFAKFPLALVCRWRTNA